MICPCLKITILCQSYRHNCCQNASLDHIGSNLKKRANPDIQTDQSTKLVNTNSNYSTLALLYEFNDVVTVELFKAWDEKIDTQSSVAGIEDPVSQQRQTRIHLTTEFLQHTSLISCTHTTFFMTRTQNCMFN